MRQADDRPAGGAAAAATDGAAVAAQVAALDAALGQLRSAADALTEVQASLLPKEALTRGVRDLAAVDGRLDGVQARWTRAATAAGVPERSGATSTTDWLSTTTGRSRHQSARTDRMARTAEEAPEVVDRLASGELGPDQADAVARGLDQGTLDPADAADLVANAGHLPPGPFNRERKRLEGRRHQQRLREQEDAAHQARRGSLWRTDDSSLGLEVLVPPAEGDLVEKTFDAFVQPDPAEVPDHLRRTPRQLRADALVDICRVALAAGPHGEVRGEPPRITVHVGPEMLAAQADAEEAGATAVSDLDTVLSVAATQRLLCDASFQRLVVDPQGQVLDVGRATRRWPSATRAAIVALDGRDRTPGSDLPPGRCDIHHLRFWSQGGETSVDNGILVGPRGHDMVHDEGWTVEMDPATRICTWTSPDGGTTVLTYPQGTAARGPGAPHDIPELRATRPVSPAAPTSPAATTPEDDQDGRSSPGDRGPPGRASPDRARPTRHGMAPLQLDL